MTRNTYLEITYRHGRPLAAYLHLPGSKVGEKAGRTKEVAPGLVVDFAADGRALGVEIVNPTMISLKELNGVLASLQLEPLDEKEFAPLERNEKLGLTG